MTPERSIDESPPPALKATHAELLARAVHGGRREDITHALGIIARARGMSRVARESGLAREALYRALSRDGDPKLSTLVRVVRALGVRFALEGWCDAVPERTRPDPDAPVR
jgi:probable addiction module antidote protein